MCFIFSQPGDPEEKDASVDSDASENDDNVSIDSSIDNESLTQKDTKKLKFTPKRGKSVVDEELKMLKSATGFLESMKNNKPTVEESKLDEFDTFGRYVANEMRQITNPQQLRIAKDKIGNILFEGQSGIIQVPDFSAASQPPLRVPSYNAASQSPMRPQWQGGPQGPQFQSSFLGNFAET